ncbi:MULTISPECIES: nucleobase:cation symporter-2 family protein [unclassified Streptomyces]|uniref:nucleobase:cation symporter-2 family protein n=1 Tax=unclassified Streptomyces TaxID=2593676 RepID=UPI001BECDDC3|nr:MULTISPECIES: nucleobase:cation symporter-2 family protein [unclassified Streptomyces]MBT2404328.1 purine permease [Streptomyces sp. ISL-21]MBT2458127.1 purine permease [Streptomyces sp. ISL-86]MBT2607121.1 purine permease [Streptomyces sp. ISL-87]
MARVAARPSAKEDPSTHPVDEVLPLPKLALYGFQHVLAFYAGAVIVPIIVGGALGLTTEQLVYLINADLFTCGIASIIQAWGIGRIGARLPLIQGVTFTAVSPMIAIGLGAGGGTAGLLVVYGAVITAGIATFAFAWLPPKAFRTVMRLFPPVVTGTVITVLGIVLIPVGLNDAAGGVGSPDFGDPKNFAYAGGTMLFILVLMKLGKPFLSSISILLGLVGGTVVAFLLGDAKFGDVTDSDWIGITTPFHYGAPKFAWFPILLMLIVMLITMVETTGDTYAVGDIVGKDIDSETVARALRADGAATALGGVLNSFPYVAFAENVGLVRMTKVKSRFVVVAAGVFMIVLGLLPKAAAIVAAVPHGVLGGAATVMFAMVALAGIQTLAKVDLKEEKNALVVGVSLAFALLPATVPVLFKDHMDADLSSLLNSGVTLGATAAIVLNLIFNGLGKGDAHAAPHVELPAQASAAADAEEAPAEEARAEEASAEEASAGEASAEEASAEEASAEKVPAAVAAPAGSGASADADPAGDAGKADDAATPAS